QRPRHRTALRLSRGRVAGGRRAGAHSRRLEPARAQAACRLSARPSAPAAHAAVPRFPGATVEDGREKRRSAAPSAGGEGRAMSKTARLHFICGKIASGKTTLAIELAARHSAVLFCEDAWLVR